MEPHNPIMATIGGKRFELRVDVLTMRQLRKLDPPIDITKLVDPDDPARGLWAEMRDDPGVVVDIAFWAIQGQPGAPSDPLEFGRGLQGSELESLYQAVLRACVDFSPSRQHRELMTKIIDKVDEVSAKLSAQAMERLDQADLEDRIVSELERSTGGSGNSQDISESIRGGSRSES